MLKCSTEGVDDDFGTDLNRIKMCRNFLIRLNFILILKIHDKLNKLQDIVQKSL